jgi:hypothetical protein
MSTPVRRVAPFFDRRAFVPGVVEAYRPGCWLILVAGP